MTSGEPEWHVTITRNPVQVRLVVWEGDAGAAVPLTEDDIGKLMGALGGAAAAFERERERKEQG